MKSDEFVDSDSDTRLRAACSQSADEELVALVMSGDQDAFSLIWRKYQGRLFRIALRITRNEHDAEDAVQESFLKAYSRINTFKYASSISTWLTRIVINCSLTELRRQRSQPTSSLDEGEVINILRDPAIDIENAIACDERSRLLNEGIARLKPWHRVIIEQRNADLSVVEIAGHFGLTVSAAKARLSRAKKALISSSWIAKSALPIKRNRLH